MIAFQCPKCGREGSAADSQAGAAHTCPGCGHATRVGAGGRPAGQGPDRPVWKGRPSALCYQGNYVFAGAFLLLGSMWAGSGNVPFVLWGPALLIGGLVALRAILDRVRTFYTVTARAIRVRRGILSWYAIEFAASDICDIQVRQGHLDHLLGVGNIGFFTPANRKAQVVFRGVRNPHAVAHQIRTSIESAILVPPIPGDPARPNSRELREQRE